MPDDELMTTEEVAHTFRVNMTTVRRWIMIGALKAVILPHIGYRQIYRVRRSDVEKILRENKP